MKLDSKLNLLLLLIVILSLKSSCQTKEISSMEKKQYNSLTNEEKRVILNKGTEYPFTGEYNNHYAKGTYVCRQCDNPLYKSDFSEFPN